ncbi:MAG: glutathione peroxidase [Cyclobacteriaceae bacterium]|nr:glutathione peroxidase [Cyclobacteriaceae bacterium]
MKRTKKIITLLMFIFVLNITYSQSIHEFKIQALDSDEIIDFSKYKGKKILIVNVASKCGYTYQYEDLQKLFEVYSSTLVVVGFPCNQFLNQEPEKENLISEFCKKNYGVTFPLTTKVDVKGKEQHPIYEWLTSKDSNGKDNYTISWNFNKFLLDEEGKLIAHFGSKTEPFDEEIIHYLDSNK